MSGTPAPVSPRLHVLVTGAGGFIGGHLVDALRRAGHRVSCVVRRGSRADAAAPDPDRVEIDDIAEVHDWAPVLSGVDAVVHLAARVHVMREHAADPLAAFRRVNLDGTRRLAEACIAAGVRRFVYVSTIKVNGESTGGRPFRADDRPAPADPYAVSKWEAECALATLADAGATEFVVVRPPLVYGPGERGNLRRLVRWVMRGVPLPLRLVDNRRSLVAVDNLVDLLCLCLVHPAATGQVFLAADGVDWSTPQLVEEIAAGLGRPARLWPLPVAWLRALGALAGRSAEVARLVGSLQVDIAKNRELLGWTPPRAARPALLETVRVLAAVSDDA